MAVDWRVKVKKGFAAMAAFGFLGACVDTSPVVSAYNGNSVSIQTPGLNPYSPPAAEDAALAAKTCQGNAEFASGRMIADAVVEYLFICR